jgi:hypothetical protein
LFGQIHDVAQHVLRIGCLDSGLIVQVNHLGSSLI